MGYILTSDEFNKVVQELTEEQLAKVYGGSVRKPKASTTGTPSRGDLDKESNTRS